MNNYLDFYNGNSDSLFIFIYIYVINRLLLVLIEMHVHKRTAAFNTEIIISTESIFIYFLELLLL